jgi:hypothetical protein
VPEVAYSKASWYRAFATSCQPLPPLPYVAFYVTFLQNPDIVGQNQHSEPSYSGSFLRRVAHRLAWRRTAYAAPLLACLRGAFPACFAVLQEPQTRRRDQPPVGELNSLSQEPAG